MPDSVRLSVMYPDGHTSEESYSYTSEAFAEMSDWSGVDEIRPIPTVPGQKSVSFLLVFSDGSSAVCEISLVV